MEGVVLYVILVKVFVKAVEKRYCVAFTMISYGKKLHLYSPSNIIVQSCFTAQRHYSPVYEL